MNNLHIPNSYKVWRISEMNKQLPLNCVTIVLNRPLWTIYVEWWLHNIGYYLTKPFPFLAVANERFRNVDLNEWK